jgi:hypothetical protein
VGLLVHWNSRGTIRRFVSFIAKTAPGRRLAKAARYSGSFISLKLWVFHQWFRSEAFPVVLISAGLWGIAEHAIPAALQLNAKLAQDSRLVPISRAIAYILQPWEVMRHRVEEASPILFALIFLEWIVVLRHANEPSEHAHETQRLQVIGLMIREQRNLNHGLSLPGAVRAALLATYRNNILLASRELLKHSEVKPFLVSFMEPDPFTLALNVTWKENSLFIAPAFSLTPPQGAAGLAFTSKIPVYIPHVRWRYGILIGKNLDTQVDVYLPGGSQFQSVLCVPVLDLRTNTTVVAVVNFSSHDPDAFSPDSFDPVVLTAQFLAATI